MNDKNNLSDVIPDQDHWTKGAYAKDAKNNPVTSNSKEACRYCLRGAVYYGIEKMNYHKDAQDVLSEVVIEKFSPEEVQELKDIESDIVVRYNDEVAKWEDIHPTLKEVDRRIKFLK